MTARRSGILFLVVPLIIAFGLLASFMIVSARAPVAPQHDSRHDASAVITPASEQPAATAEMLTQEINPLKGPEEGAVVPAVDIVRDPADLPPPLAKREPQIVKVFLVAQELEGKLNPLLGGTYEYWTFNGKVPGPMIRVRQGDVVEVTLKNEGRLVSHSIDLHAALGPGGGTDLTEAKQGESKTFTFKAIVPGVYVYHCGTNLAAQHISSGMYGLIVVEPPEGLPRVDHEFYVMQGELYTVEDIGGQGHQKMSLSKLMDERPEYFVFYIDKLWYTELHVYSIANSYKD